MQWFRLADIQPSTGSDAELIDRVDFTLVAMSTNQKHRCFRVQHNSTCTRQAWGYISTCYTPCPVHITQFTIHALSWHSNNSKHICCTLCPHIYAVDNWYRFLIPAVPIPTATKLELRSGHLRFQLLSSF